MKYHGLTGKRRRTLRRLSAVAFLALVLSACSYVINKDYSYNNEGGYRDNIVLSRNISRAMYSVLASQGQTKTAQLMGDQIVGEPALDHWVCPGADFCTTTSEYTYGHPSDLAGAIRDSSSNSQCLTITLTPSYNWTRKGGANGCIYN